MCPKVPQVAELTKPEDQGEVSEGAVREMLMFSLQMTTILGRRGQPSPGSRSQSWRESLWSATTSLGSGGTRLPSPST